MRCKQDVCSIIVAIKDERERKIVQKRDTLHRMCLKRYYEKLLNVDNTRDGNDEWVERECPIVLAVKELKNRKDSGPSEVTVEMIKSRGDNGVEWMLY